VDGLWATKSESVGLIICAISFQGFQETDGQTNRWHTIAIPSLALFHACNVLGMLQALALMDTQIA